MSELYSHGQKEKGGTFSDGAEESFSEIPEEIKILLIEDDRGDFQLISECLRKSPDQTYKIAHSSSLEDAFKYLDLYPADLIFLDLFLPDSQSLDTYLRLSKKYPNMPVIILSRLKDDDMARESIRLGAMDYLHKEEINERLLPRMVHYAIERHLMRKALVASERKYAGLIESAPDPMVLLSPLGKLLNINPAVEKITGYDRAFFIGRHFTRLGIMRASSVARALKEFALVVSGKERPPFELELKSKDGREIVVEANPNLLKENHKVKGIQIIFRDMTNRKKIENEVLLAREKYQSIFDNSAVAITVTDKDEKIVSWNAFAEKILGMGKSDLEGKHVSTLYPEDEWKKLRSYNIRRKGMEPHVETQVFKKNGAIMDVDLSITVLKDVDGNILGSIGIMKDITEKKMAVRALEYAEERYRTIFNHSAAAITVTNADEQIISWNKTTEMLLGMEPKDLFMKKVSVLYPESEWTRIRSMNIRKKGIDHRLETKMIRKDGSLIDVSISISVQKDDEGKVTGSIGIMQDITEAKAFDRLKDEFVSTVSHELRTPMFVIREGVSQLLDGVLGNVSDKQQNFLRITLRNIDRVSKIINNLLDVSKIESGRLQIERELVDLQELTHGVIESFSGRAEKKGLELKESYPEKPVQAYVDRDKVIQVLTNLVGNALKFTEKGHVEVSLSERDHVARWRISDTGRGIAEKDLGKIFDKFHQLVRVGASGEKGTGLGLTISKGLIELHHGKLWAESRVGQGTHFMISLPMLNSVDVFKECAEAEFKKAAEHKLPLSVLEFDIKDYSTQCKKLGREGISKILQQLELAVKTGSRQYGDHAGITEHSVMMILPGADKKDATEEANRLHGLLKKRMAQNNGKSFEFDVHILEFPDDGGTEEEIYSKLGIEQKKAA